MYHIALDSTPSFQTDSVVTELSTVHSILLSGQLFLSVRYMVKLIVWVWAHFINNIMVKCVSLSDARLYRVSMVMNETIYKFVPDNSSRIVQDMERKKTILRLVILKRMNVYLINE